MEFLGIGLQELIFVIIIAIIVLGPRDMQKAGRTIGRWLNRLVRSDGWKAFQRASQEIKRLPTNLMREANLDEAELRAMDQEIRQSIDPRQAPRTQHRNLPPQRKADLSPESPAETDIPKEQDD